VYISEVRAFLAWAVIELSIATLAELSQWLVRDVSSLSSAVRRLKLSHPILFCECILIDALAKTHGMAKQKFHPTRLGAFSGAKAYIWYVEVLKKRHNAVGWTFCDAILIAQ
jgi:hypothetical protein